MDPGVQFRLQNGDNSSRKMYCKSVYFVPRGGAGPGRAGQALRKGAGLSQPPAPGEGRGQALARPVWPMARGGGAWMAEAGPGAGRQCGLAGNGRAEPPAALWAPGEASVRAGTEIAGGVNLPGCGIRRMTGEAEAEGGQPWGPRLCTRIFKVLFPR